MIRLLLPAPPPATHVALSSLERSALQVALFDPAAMVAIRAGTRINLVDADDSGILNHVVALAEYPDALWRAAAPVFLRDVPTSADTQDIARLYAIRSVPDPRLVTRAIPLRPAELEIALESDHPDAMAKGDAIGARIHCMHRLRSSPGTIAYPGLDAFSRSAWDAVANEMASLDGSCWAPDLLLRRNALFQEAGRERADALIRELEASLWIAREAPFNCGQDFDTYQSNMMRAVMANDQALEILRTDAESPFEVSFYGAVADALTAAGHDWRATASDKPQVPSAA